MLIRIAAILAVYVLVFFIGAICRGIIYRDINEKVYAEPLLTTETFLDDLIIVKFGCAGENTPVSFVVKDEYGNIRHNSSSVADCNKFNKVSLQGSPIDYTRDRRYIVYATFNNQTINSGYFSLKEENSVQTAWKEIIGFFAFMVYESREARGAYADKERLLWIETGDIRHGQNYMFSHLIGILYALTAFLFIDIIIWVAIGARNLFKA